MHYTATAAGGEDSRIRHETQRKSAAAAYSGAAARRSYAARAERRSVGRPNERRIQFPYMAFAYGKIGGNGSLARATMCV